jgi:hypothetical protein
MATQLSHSPPESPADALARLRPIAQGLNQVDCDEAIDRTIETLAEGQLRVTVLGQFKRGKSTLLNALFGRELLPTGLLPVTSVATEVREGSGELLVVRNDGRSELVPLSTLPEFVTEAGNPENIKGVRRVEVRVPFPSWAGNAVFVDSPGIASIHPRATAEAYRLGAGVDAAIFVLSPQPPISEAELAFLRTVRGSATKFFFVMNKIDEVPERERTELLEYVQRVLRGVVETDGGPLYCVSARRVLRAGTPPETDPGSAPGWSELLADLGRYLGSGRAASLREIGERRVAQFAERLRGMVDLAQRSLSASDATFESAVRSLGEAIDRTAVERRAADALLEDDVVGTVAAIDRHLARLRAEGQAPVLASLDEFLASARSWSAARLVRGFDERFRELLVPRVREWRTTLEEEAAGLLSAACGRYARRMESSLREVDRAAGESFDLRLASLALDVPFTDLSRYYLRVPGLLDGSLAGQSALLLPAALLRGRMRSRLARTVAEKLDEQSGLIRTDLIDRLRMSVGQYRDAVAGAIDRNVASVQAAMHLGRAQRDAGAGPRDAWRTELARWRQSLDGLVGTGGSAPRTGAGPSPGGPAP